MSLSDFKIVVKQPLRIATLLFLVTEQEVLLAMKKRGFGKDKFNGVGGKVDFGEDVESAAVRETKEEIGVTPLNFWHVADLDFYFPHEPVEKDWNQRVAVYLCDKWGDEPKESDEMAPAWYNKKNLPYKEMWPDDPLWLPRVLQSEKLQAEFAFDNNGGIEQYQITKTALL